MTLGQDANIPEIGLLHHEQPLAVYIVIEELFTVGANARKLEADPLHPVVHVILRPAVYVVLFEAEQFRVGCNQLDLHLTQPPLSRFQKLFLHVQVVFDLF